MYERLTYRYGENNEHAEFITIKKDGYARYRASCEGALKLAAYEDSGLSPEEVQKLKKSDASKEQCTIDQHGEIHRLRDELKRYKQAEQEGRLVVLPCNVGDTVYVVVHCDEVIKDCDDDYVTGTGEITCPFEGSCVFEECDDSNKILVETCVTGLWCESEGVWKVFFEYLNADIGVNDFGKTVFLTREEAEAAMKGAEHDRD